jgi:uncharacterized protein
MARGGFRAEQFMQIFLLRRRSTASGNGIGAAGTELRYKRPAPGAARRAFPPTAGREAVATDAEGAIAVAVARGAVVRAVGGPGAPAEASDLPPIFSEPRGAFVTLREARGERLRGCIGYPMPVLALRTALVRAAVGAALHDPRFPPVDPSELPGLTVEVSLLTVPETIRSAGAEELARSVRVGRDGLIVESAGASGLLLPQVAAEEGWTGPEFLDAACEKAGLPAGAWRTRAVTVRRFEAEVFSERAPGGEVVRLAAEVSRSAGGPSPRS